MAEPADTSPRGFPVDQRTLLLIGSAVAIALIALWFLVLRTSWVVLFADQRDADAAAVVAELDARKIPYRLEDGGTTILVPEDQSSAARLAIAGSDLPARGQVGFELFNESDMGLTDFAQRINYQRALQGELVRTIMAMDGIASARVHLALPERSLFRGARGEPRAAVTLAARTGTSITPDTVAGIQQLVAGAVPDLAPAAVSVLDARGRLISPVAAQPDDGLSGPAARERQAVITYYTARAEAALAPLLGDARKAWHLQLAVLPGDAGPATAVDAADAAAPARNFRLLLSITTVQPLSDAARQQAEAALAAAIDYAPGNDRLTWRVGDPAMYRTPAPAAGSGGWAMAPAAPTATRAPAPGLPDWLWPAVAVALIVLVAVLALRRKPLVTDNDEPARFADLLSRRLAEERGN